MPSSFSTHEATEIFEVGAGLVLNEDIVLLMTFFATVITSNIRSTIMKPIYLDSLYCKE